MELLERFALGDLEAFEALFRQFQGQVYRWIVRIVRDHGVAEDVSGSDSGAAVPALMEAGMNRHPYLRAYMAGIVVPTVLLLVMLTVFTIARCVYRVAIPIERVIVFPMALVPNLWGAWNMLFVLLRPRRHLPLGFHGAVLPFLIAPLAFAIARALDVPIPGSVTTAFSVGFPVAVVLYYLAWKYLVAFFNELLGIL